jgi:oligopeptide transport system substrate-binding protein
MLRTRFLAVISFFLLPVRILSAADAAQDGVPTVEFTVAHSLVAYSLDPLHAYTSFECQFYSAIYEGLVVNDPATLEPIPGTASKWEVSADGRTYKFSIRPEAAYSNGTPVRAQDFVDSWLRMIDPASKAEYSFLFDPIKGAKAFRIGVEKDPKKVGIRATAEKTLEVELEKPATYFLKALCHIAFLPVYPPYLKARDWGGSASVVGNGPFAIISRSAAEIVLEKNAKYWDAGKVRLERLRVRFFDDANEAKATDEFLAGDIDWAHDIYPTEKLTDPAKLKIFPLFSTSYFYFVCDKPPWNDSRVRRALALLVPWTDLRSSENFLFPDSRLVPAIPQYPKVTGIDSQAPKEAMTLLSDAGFPTGKGLPTLKIQVASQDNADLVRIMTDAWEESIGLKSDIVVFSGLDYISEQKKANFDMSASSWVGDYADPLTFLQLWLSDSNLNDAHFSDASYDSTVNDSLSLQDVVARYKKLGQAEDILLSRAVVLPFSHRPSVDIIDLDAVDGWYSNVLDLHPFKFIGRKARSLPPGVALAH